MIMKRLIESRKLCNLSQEVLSGLVGVARNTYASWESGEREMKAVDLKKISEILGVTADYLLGESDVPAVGNKAFSSGEELSACGNTVAPIEIEFEMDCGETKVKIKIPPGSNEADICRIFEQIANFQKNTTSPN